MRHLPYGECLTVFSIDFLFFQRRPVGIGAHTRPMLIAVGFADVVMAVGALAMALAIATKNYAGLAKATAVMALGAAGRTGAYFVNEQTTPKAATGAIATKITGGTQVTVGEGMHDEAIIPLGNSKQFSDMKSDIAGAVVQGLSGMRVGSDQPINITINVDEDYIYKAYNRQAKNYGGR